MQSVHLNPWYHNKQRTHFPTAQLFWISAAVKPHFGVSLHLILPRLSVLYFCGTASHDWKLSVSLLHSLLFTPLQPVVSLLFLFVFSLWGDERSDIAGDKIMKGKQREEKENVSCGLRPEASVSSLPISLSLSDSCLPRSPSAPSLSPFLFLSLSND